VPALIASETQPTRFYVAKHLGAMIALLLACGVVLGLGIGALHRAFVMPTGADGACFVLDETTCSSLSATGIETATGLIVPPGTEIVDSGSSRFVKAGTAFALLRLPSGTTSEQLGKFEPELDTGAETNSLRGPESYIREQLSERGVTNITDVWSVMPGGTYDSGTVAMGTDDAGTTWAYVEAHWDG
jgi:hypothetical protein